MANENPNDRLGKLIKTFKRTRLSMRQLGILTNIDPATVSRIINGKQPPKQNIYKICRMSSSSTPIVI